MKLRLVPAVVVVLAAFTSVAMAQTMVGNTAKGKVLTDSHGMTLYTFVKDSKGKSACNGKCAENWPPLKVSDGAKAGKGYSVVTRADGSKQWAYKGKPLYTWIKDKKPGDVTGDNFKKIWHVAKP
jgi:predicted lipoprotein with Yx(FWY)xxD motif